MRNKLLATALLFVSFATPGVFASGDSEPSTSTTSAPTAAVSTHKVESSANTRHVGIGFKTSLLGLGADVAVPVTPRSNLRVGFAMLNYGRGFDKDGVNYSGKLGLRSVQALYDFFPFAGGFHLSPGVMLYSGNQITANAAVPGGQMFSLGDSDYVSDPSNPLNGKGKLHFSKAGPMFLIGFGNLARRSERRFGMTFDIGAVYQGVPRTTLSFAGAACDSTGTNCREVSSDSTFQSNMISEQAKINRSASPFRFYPVICVGFGYRF